MECNSPSYCEAVIMNRELIEELFEAVYASIEARYKAGDRMIWEDMRMRELAEQLRKNTRQDGARERTIIHCN
jgi:hypothetical protein